MERERDWIVTSIQPHRFTSGQIDRQTGREREREREKETDRPRQTDRRREREKETD